MVWYVISEYLDRNIIYEKIIKNYFNKKSYIKNNIRKREFYINGSEEEVVELKKQIIYELNKYNAR